jgi:protein arginine N-methyltransferase 1
LVLLVLAPTLEKELMSDSDYFSSYGDLRVHELLLKDSLRVDAYAQAIEDNQFDFRDKIILDVGAGTGFSEH